GDFQKANLISIENVDSAHQKKEDLAKFVENLIDFGGEEIVISQETQTPSIESEDLHDSDSDLHSLHEEDHVSIGADIPVLDSLDEIKYEEPSTNYDIFHLNLENVNFDKEIVDESSCFVVHPIGDVLENEEKMNHVDNCDCVENMFTDDRIESGYVEINQEIESEKSSIKDEEFETEDLHLSSFEKDMVQVEKGEDLHSQDLKFFIHYSGNQLFPFELHDSKTEELGEVGELIDLKTEETRHSLEDEDHEFG
nr:zein-binding domain-containing protein [Tanacetum cinerariifolium]